MDKCFIQTDYCCLSDVKTMIQQQMLSVINAVLILLVNFGALRPFFFFISEHRPTASLLNNQKCVKLVFPTVNSIDSKFYQYPFCRKA